MSTFRSAGMLAILAGAVAILTLPGLFVRNRASVASLAKGTEDAFSSTGFEPRENQIGGGAIRWLRPKATFEFKGVGPGLVDIDLVVRGHRTEVTMIANGAFVGNLLPGQDHFHAQIPLSGPTLVFGVETDGFTASGRTLGTQFVSLRIEPKPTPAPVPGSAPMRLWLTTAAVFLVACLTQAVSGLPLLVAWLPLGALLLMVLPAGLWRSPWLIECAILIAGMTVLSSLASMRAAGSSTTRGFLQVTLLLALIIHGVLPPSPLMIQGDAQLHGNKLAEVARGNLFPTSRTDHQPPFEIPYGFSFYGVLSPFVSAEGSNVRLVREGAALCSALSALALAFVLGRTSAGKAAVSMTLWALAPVNIRTMAFGNLSNVFAQAIFVLFLVGAASRARSALRTGLLGSLVALSALAHLSSFIVLTTLLFVTLLLARDLHGPAFKPLLAGVLVASVYFSGFLPMIAAQLPRLLDERGGSAGVFDPWRLPDQILLGAGWPLVGLVILSILVGSPRGILPLSRSLAVSGALLAVAALVSPVEVRYLLALLPIMAIVGASVFGRDDGPCFPKPNLSAIVDLPWLRTLGSELVALPLACALLVAALVHGLRVLKGFIPLAGS